MLFATSDRLRECRRPLDTAARFGGDEFAILLEDVVDMRDATLVAERIVEELQRLPFALEVHKVFVTLMNGSPCAALTRTRFRLYCATRVLCHVPSQGEAYV